MFFCFAIVSYLILLYWIPGVMVRYGGTTWFLGIVGLVCLAAFFSGIAAVAGVLIGKIQAGGKGVAAAFWISAIWVAKDLVIEKIFGGFPWCLVGYSQFKNLYFIQAAEIGGVHLVSFLVIAVNVLLYLALKKKGKGSIMALAVTLTVVYAGGFCLLRNHQRGAASVPWHRAGIIQPNTNHDEAFDFVRVQSGLEKLFFRSKELKERGAEFVIWPEFTVPIYPLQTPYFKRRFDAFSRDHAPLLAGFTDYGGSDKVFNSVILFTNGKTEKYDKVHLTPFGEYVPFRRLLFFVKKITDEIGDFSPGEKIHNLALNGRMLSTPICYEVIYPELVRAMIARGGEAVITVSNDSWFGKTSAPYQHLAMAAFRSVENRRWLLRSTSNGISAVVDPAGRIVRRSPLHREDEFLADFQYLTRRTVFNRWGYLFPYACLILVLIGFLWRTAGRRITRRPS